MQGHTHADENDRDVGGAPKVAHGGRDADKTMKADGYRGLHDGRKQQDPQRHRVCPKHLKLTPAEEHAALRYCLGRQYTWCASEDKAGVRSI